jgi:hypothetical protein
MTSGTAVFVVKTIKKKIDEREKKWLTGGNIFVIF